MNNLIQNKEAKIGKRFEDLGYRWVVWSYYKKQEIKDIISNNKGMGIIELALIIVIIVALAFVFRNKIAKLLNDIFQQMNVEDLKTLPEGN